jgi:hypothetical protein
MQCPNCQTPLARLMAMFQKTLCCCPYSNQLLQIAGDWWSPTPGSLQPPTYWSSSVDRHSNGAHKVSTRVMFELSPLNTLASHLFVKLLHISKSIFRAFQPTMCREMHRCTHLLYQRKLHCAGWGATRALSNRATSWRWLGRGHTILTSRELMLTRAVGMWEAI